MKLFFSDNEIAEQINVIELEGEEVTLIAEEIEGEGKNFIIKGKAIIEGETYNDFLTEIELVENLKEVSAKNIVEAEWDWFDYIC